jgi:hypothetical protein
VKICSSLPPTSPSDSLPNSLSFTVLDGIGKSLSPRFDISEISAPYARELILDGRPQLARLQEKVAKGLKRQNEAVKGLFDGPIKINEIGGTLKRCAGLPPYPSVELIVRFACVCSLVSAFKQWELRKLSSLLRQFVLRT